MPDETINNDLRVSNNVDVQQNLQVSGNGYVYGNLNVSGPLSVENALQLNGGKISSDNQDLQLCITSNPILTIRKDNGRVGIGHTNPRTQLHVLEGISTGLDFKSAGSITFYPPDGAAWFHIDNGPTGGRPTGRLRISHGGSPGKYELVSILQNGNIGIGISNPDVKLQIVGNRVRLTKAENSRHYLDLRTDGSALDIESSTDLYLNNNGKPVFYRNLQKVSSKAFKEAITPFSRAEAALILAGLDLVRFRYKDDCEQRMQLGFIAEDVPDDITTEDKKSIDPMGIIAVLCSVVREQQEQISDLQRQLDQFENEIRAG